ncbi:protein FAM214A [Anthonomus grandis grandis]|uniref:protein FAM214A n=1 Tax=Anthonomus grandis grandis TaxID=2921223 RepID=UPI002166149A|nr:protein FAM214A [Anthonomus grandis grandis]
MPFLQPTSDHHRMNNKPRMASGGTSCTLKGKHCCEGTNVEAEPFAEKLSNKFRQLESSVGQFSKLIKSKFTSPDMGYSSGCDKDASPIDGNDDEEGEEEEEEVVFDGYSWPYDANDLAQDKGQMLLDAIERSGRKSNNNNFPPQRADESDNNKCDNSKSASDNSFSLLRRNNDNFNGWQYRHPKTLGAKKKLTFADDEECQSVQNTSKPIDIPQKDCQQAKVEAGRVSGLFNARTGLPFNSSPAPIRKGKTVFDFEPTSPPVKSPLLSTSLSTDEESESDGIVSPCSPEIISVPRTDLSLPSFRRRGQHTSLLGTFEESLLNDRLPPVSKVDGFTAELGASGSFVPKHLFVPVTAFFYSFGDPERVTTPYMGHIGLGRKGYNVPKIGTVQVTLFNPLGTVVKMFVLSYDLCDMPPNSKTFIRQRVLYMPTDYNHEKLVLLPKWLRYLIHIKFMTSKSGKIYLHSDIKMIVMRKSDMDTATAHQIDINYELRSFIVMPTNPRYSPRK